MNHMKKILLAGLLLPVLAQATDSIEGVAVGGILLNNTDRISLKKQVLNINRAAVTSDYELINDSATPLEETITFPLPEYAVAKQAANTYYGEPVGLRITVDGQPAPFKTVLIARVNHVDVTPQLRKLGLTDAQIAYNPTFGVELAYNPLTPAQQDQLAKLKLWTKDASGVAGPAWSVQPTYVWKQKFPVKQVVRVQYAYRPFVTTGAASGPLQSDFTTRYCADKAFMGAWKRAKSKAGKDTLEGSHVHFLLKNGNAFRNGIEDFTLNVGKLDAGELVTLCFPGDVRKPQAKTFQFRQTNFKPKQDLDIYFGNLGPTTVKSSAGVMPTLNR
jgi:hypothetical protein